MYHVRITNHDGWVRLVGLLEKITEQQARTQAVDLFERGANQMAELWWDMTIVDTYTAKGWNSNRGKHRKMAAE